jgi:omega-amidase
LSAEFRKVHQYNVFCTFAPAQHAFAAMIGRAGTLRTLGAFYQAKRDRFREQLLATKLKPLPVPGGYFQLVDYSAVSDLDDAAFCRWLTIEKGVTAIPLSPFYETPPAGQRLARLCFAKNDSDAGCGDRAVAGAVNNLRVSIVQGETRWHDPAGNRDYYGELIAPLHGITDLVVLPETFTSGFSNDAIGNAETMDGPTVEWIREQARKLDAAVTGSVQLRTEAGVFNRMLFATPDGGLTHYDKRHLFSFAKRTRALRRRQRARDVEWKGWRICRMVCYDLRFPVFARNRLRRGSRGCAGLRPALYVANWPSARAYPWKTLLRARAIENLCYVVGVNRVGTDGNGLHYSGDSAVIDFLGHAVSEATDEEVVTTTTLQAAELAAHRQRFPAMLDGDAFRLLDEG